MSESRYDVPESCNKCGGLNEFTKECHENGVLCEAETKCKVCGLTDYWAYGHFESGSDIESKSDVYWFENGVCKQGKRGEL